MTIVKIFGNSITNEPSETQHGTTFVRTVLNHYNCYDTYDVCRGVARCSEERILFYLKKIRKIDVAVIFHGMPHTEFCVGCVDDFANGDIDEEDLEYMLENNIERSFYTDMHKKLPVSRSDAKLHVNAVVAKQMLAEHNARFFHRDLQVNRFYGALIQIDQYLTAKNIKAVHCVHNRMPTWFKFSSGIVDTEIAHYQYDPVYGCSYAKSGNAITPEGNAIIEQRLISYIDKLIDT
jgi:hypothetical protein